MRREPIGSLFFYICNMNALQMRMRIDELNDRTKSPRFTDDKYYSAINQAIQMVINDRIENIKQKKKYSVQSVQRVRDELYTLIITNVPIAPASDILAYPTDYYYYLYLDCVIDGVTSYAKPTTYNKIGPLKLNSFKKPSDVKPYYNETSTGLRVLHGSGTFTSGILDYIKMPNIVSIGNAGNKLTSASGVLSVLTTYYVYDECVYSGVTYYDGTTFTTPAFATALTSGTVIAAANVVNCDLPEILQNEVIRMASAIMNGTIEDYNKKQDLKSDIQYS